MPWAASAIPQQPHSWMRNALTFDVEEYFHCEAFVRLVSREDWPRFPSRVAESTRRILDMLESRGVAATFFVLGWVAERQSALLRDIAGRGHEVASHGYAHRVVYAQQPSAFRDDLRRAKQAIEDTIGRPVDGYRAPTFSIVRRTVWAFDVLAEEGFRYDSSVFPIRHDRYGIPDAPRFPHRLALPSGGHIVEFPMTTLEIARQRLPFSGGGYFRLLPYGAVRMALRHVNEQEGMPGIVYLHPWELDPGQPRMPVHGLTRFRHYVNLRQTGGKLAKLLGDFDFDPASRVLTDLGLIGASA